MANETPSRPPPFMANAILNFDFDFLHTSLSFFTVSPDFQCQKMVAANQSYFVKKFSILKKEHLEKKHPHFDCKHIVWVVN